MKKKLLFVIATDRYFLSHRLSWAQKAQEAGYEVALATAFHHNDHRTFIEQQGIQTFPLYCLKRGIANPLYDIAALIELAIIYYRYQPDIVHHVALKPIIFGSLIAKAKKILKKTPFISSAPAVLNTFGGLGFVFTKQTSLRPFVQWLLRKALCYTAIIVQNEADKNTLLEAKCADSSAFHCIPGAGIRVEDFSIEPLPSFPPYRFVFIGRLLWTKGLGELMVAARLLQQEGFPFCIDVWGEGDEENPESIPLSTLKEWEKSRLITLKGYCNNVQEAYASSHVAVLPSYREGLPKSLLEAAACGRAIITTDVPGCKDVVKPGETGWLIPEKDSAALAQLMKESVKDFQQCEEKGIKGRQYVQTFFSDTRVHEAILRIYEQIEH